MEEMETEAGKFGRRKFLKAVAVGGVAVVAGSTLLAACSSSDTDEAADAGADAGGDAGGENNKSKLSEFAAYDPAAAAGSAPSDLPKSVA